MKNTLLTILSLLLIVGCSKKPEGVFNEEGNKEGKWTTWYEPEKWYSSDSEKKSEGEYNNGEKIGKWTYWYENGNKKEEGETVKKKKVGKWTYWYENGNKKETIYLAKNGNLTKKERMSDCGNTTTSFNTDGSVRSTTESPDIEKYKKKARQFAFDRLRNNGSGINFYSSSSNGCRYNFSGNMFDRYNNPHFFSISVEYNGYSWSVENINIQ
ncbi:hypothetical protein HN615_06535 [Candidatus Woesearchaeota archaeon]|nr:hypothetical protein [Candidatus Woesearchaeota archaeon]